MKFILIVAIAASLISAKITEEFNSMEELNQNWWVSGWGNVPKQYRKENVTIEDGILKLTMIPDSLNGAPRPLCGEITYTSEKVLYGSFRASIKTTHLSGGVVGWFVYKHGAPGDGNLHEIDMEILTEDLSQIQYTLHHDHHTVDHVIDPLEFDPSAAFHEYRFDWYPDSVLFFIDGIQREILTVQVPDDSCQIMLNYWSNNNPHWGGDMPSDTSHMWVDYMHMLTLDELKNEKEVSINHHTSLGTDLRSMFSLQQDQLNFTPPSDGSYSISLYSLSGKLLHRSSARGVSTTDFSSIGSGAKLLQITGDGINYTGKVLLQ